MLSALLLQRVSLERPWTGYLDGTRILFSIYDRSDEHVGSVFGVMIPFGRKDICYRWDEHARKILSWLAYPYCWHLNRGFELNLAVVSFDVGLLDTSSDRVSPEVSSYHLVGLSTQIENFRCLVVIFDVSCLADGFLKVVDIFFFLVCTSLLLLKSVYLFVVVDAGFAFSFLSHLWYHLNALILGIFGCQDLLGYLFTSFDCSI